jgi:hypothetical protein
VKWEWKRAGSAPPFVPQSGSGLDAQHAVVARWVEEAFGALDERHSYRDVELKSLPSGRLMLEAKPAEARRYVHAAALQAAYWDRLSTEFRSQATTDMERSNPHLREGWHELWTRRRHAATVVSTLMRRTLPFEEEDLLAVLDWCNDSEPPSFYGVPVGHVTRALQRFLDTHAPSDALRERITRFAARLRATHDKDAARYGTAVEQLLAGSAASGAADVAEADEDVPAPPSPPPVPAPAGDPAVLDALKRRLGIAGEDVATEALEPDGFPLRADSPFRSEHALLGEMLASVVGTRHYSHPPLESLRGGERVLQMDRAASGRLLLAAAERDVAASVARVDIANPAVWQSRYAVASLARTLAQRPFLLDRSGVFDFLLYLGMRAAPWDRASFDVAVDALVEQVEREAARAPLTDGERYVLHLLRASRIGGPPLGVATEVTRLTALRRRRGGVLSRPGRGLDRPAER